MGVGTDGGGAGRGEREDGGPEASIAARAPLTSRIARAPRFQKGPSAPSPPLRFQLFLVSARINRHRTPGLVPADERRVSPRS